ncbi:MAG: hypothetical protein D6798_13830 [Deltaproteobacteria bacterium]|nr:MAG: hypothetical protein D6798_13830 [Deltaproteobacteria bacterium]
MAKTVTVVGAGVSGLAATMHLIELWTAAGADPDGAAAEPLEIHLVAPLVPTGGNGSGLGGKAMSREFEGPVGHGLDRSLIYGPMLPHKGGVPHGYHVMWEYPNLRRMLGDGEPGEASPPIDGGLLRPRGGAAALAVFQGRIDDPTPGGPGVAIMGLSDPEHPETATLPVTRALFRLADSPLLAIFGDLFRAIFAELSDGIDPLFFADLFYADEVDLEMRLALIAASLVTRTTDPENDTVVIDGQERHLWEVEYDAWLQAALSTWARPLAERLRQPPLSTMLETLGAWRRVLDAAIPTDDDEGDEGGWFHRALRAVLSDRQEQALDDLRLVIDETLPILVELPTAATRLLAGEYPVDKTLHFRFGPDSTFTSPYSYDAATAIRSLAFVFTTPRSARVWSADGGHWHRLWLRLWDRVKARAAATDGRVILHIHPGRATALAPDDTSATGRVSVTVSPIRGHGFDSGSDLGWPHTHRLTPWGGPDTIATVIESDVVIPAVSPTNLRALLPEDAAEAHAVLAPLEPFQNPTLEIMMWTRDRIEWAEHVARGMQGSSITGLEGGWCLLADYTCGMWSSAELAAQDPFGEGSFSGSILESCGGFDDIFACRTRDDAFGWPEIVKQAIADLVARPEHHARTDDRPWPHDESDWRARRAGGEWTPERLAAPEARDDWFVASRWMAWQFLRQLAAIQDLGPRAVRQLARYAALIDPRRLDRDEILHPPESVRSQIRYVVMVNAKPRNRIFSPSVGTWPLRPVSGLPLPGLPRVLPTGDWTRNGLDVICMEAATIGAMRTTRAAFRLLTGELPPRGAPEPTPVLPRASWYSGVDPLLRGEADARNARQHLGIGR